MTAYDTIKGNESLFLKMFNSLFLTTLSHNFKMLLCDANHMKIGYLVTKSYEELSMLKTL